MTCILEFDGASKGNPGKVGSGAVLRTKDGNVVSRVREGLGIVTNNVAEYRALILGMKYALLRGFKHIRVKGDSQLVCMQAVPPTIWYKQVAGLNAQLRLVQRGHLRMLLLPVLSWLETNANPTLRMHGVLVDLAWFQSTSFGYFQLGLVVYAVQGETETAGAGTITRPTKVEESPHIQRGSQVEVVHLNREAVLRRKRVNGSIIDHHNVHTLDDRKAIFYPLSFVMHNTKPVGHQDLVGLVISILLLGDFSLVLLTLLQLYSFTLLDVFLMNSIFQDLNDDDFDNIASAESAQEAWETLK